jgi:hypothetical protein
VALLHLLFLARMHLALLLLLCLRQFKLCPLPHFILLLLESSSLLLLLPLTLQHLLLPLP